MNLFIGHFIILQNFDILRSFGIDLIIYFLPFIGLAGYLAGVSVAVKQAMPDHVLYRSPLGKITNRNIPLLGKFIIVKKCFCIFRLFVLTWMTILIHEPDQVS